MGSILVLVTAFVVLSDALLVEMKLATGLSHALQRVMTARPNLFQGVTWPLKWPYGYDDFAREDPSNDQLFYREPRFVYHIDDAAVSALTSYYSSVFVPGSAVLDLCSSWVSHFPDIELSEACGVGINKAELEANNQLTSYVQKNLNLDPGLPYPDNKFDVVTCVVSVDYLTRPIEIFQEIHRVLKPGGVAIISQSNRCFPTKVIQMWLHSNDMERLKIIGSYFHFAGGFDNLAAFDISPYPSRTDPMYIVQATKAL